MLISKNDKFMPENRVLYVGISFMGMLVASGYSNAQQDFPVLDNRNFVESAILSICPTGVLKGTELQSRCNALVGAGLPSGILSQVTSEQTAAQKSIALEMNNSKFGLLGNRISAIRSGRQRGGLNISGLMLDSNGNPLLSNQLAGMDPFQNKAAAGDDGYERLGIFVNGNIGFGDRRTTSNEAGYDLDTYGAVAGIDYRLSNNFLLGMAFAYNNATSEYANNLGRMEADSYSGAIYGTFFTEDGFFVDGVFSGNHIDYATRRRIQYSISESINTNATGDNSGQEFNVSMNTGYNFNIRGLTITPLVRFDYTNSQVDALNESGGEGWALHVGKQDFDSLQTAVGLQLNYAASLPWAIIMPMVRAEYIREFKNDRRNIQAFFLQDPTQSQFNIMTDKPDRDYIIVSAGLSVQFQHGISAFVNYDTVQAHSYVNNHNFSGGLRAQISF